MPEMPEKSKETILGGIAITLIVIPFIVWTILVGWWLVWVPLSVLLLCVDGIWITDAIQNARRGRPILLKKHVSELEAAARLPLAIEGTCGSCGKPLISGAKFCSYCHAEAHLVDSICAACGTRNAPDARWCGACGAALLPEPTEPVEPTEPAEPAPTPSIAPETAS